MRQMIGGALDKPGGRIAYITCSVLPPENGEQIPSFITRHPEFAVVPPSQTMTVLWDKAEDFATRTCMHDRLSPALFRGFAVPDA
jgi:16S rRNA C967 or C1407 C5-methylase (RsmB/RsmF family)